MRNTNRSCLLAVIWIDWYSYHVARFRGLESAPLLARKIVGIELIGGIGVHKGLKFREPLPSDLNIETLMPESNWRDTDKWQLTRQLWWRLTELGPEVVLVPGYYTLPAIAAAIWAKLHGRISILMTESTAGDHRRIWWKEQTKSLALRVFFNWAVAGGKSHVAYLNQLGFPSDRIVGFYDVVDNDMFREGTASLRLQSSTDARQRAKYFLYVGRFAKEKNVGNLLASWVTYRNQGGTWPLVLVGDGPEADALRNSAGNCPYVADVLFPGFKNSRELLPFYAFAGCFVLPSTREPWGLVVNEAMASALPVLVSDRCGCSADLVIPGLNGFVFDPLDVVSLTTHLHNIEHLDGEQLNSMGENSARIISSFSPINFGLSIASIRDLRHGNSAIQQLAGGAL
jgi:1,2-diacylglycerol 3-alpha-glucosyltransferase